jgi:phosphatidylserine/phosphatidylglycerophosphate/cardiolipin synthase-like enzyme
MKEGQERTISERKVSGDSHVVSPGRNCWRTARASRIAFLVDADAYFEAFYETVSRARNSVLIVGWDIDSRVQLRREPGRDPEAYRLGNFLNNAAERCDALNIHILVWDYALIYAAEREPLLTFKLDLNSHPRIHFRFDDTHPFGASHHQKIVVIDDRVAFCGGIDLTSHRWDTPRHAAKNPSRITPAGTRYGPYHDVQMAVEGACASVLASLVRERWRCATGQRLAPAAPGLPSPWPHDLEPDIRNTEVAVSRTDRSDEESPVLEIKELYLDTIKAALRYIYMENQFLTSAAVGEALVRCLRKERGPEVIVVIPDEGSGLLEGASMGVMRDRIIANCREADRFDRFRVYSPYVSGDGESGVFVHAKVFIADDRILRIGSANLTNRSMGLDTECDLTVEVPDDAGHRDRTAIRRFRDRLIAEHLGVLPGEVFEAEQRTGSLLRAVEGLSGGARTLRARSEEISEWVAEMVPTTTFFDPEEPLLPRLPGKEEPAGEHAMIRPARRGIRSLFVGTVTAVAGVIARLLKQVAQQLSKR